MKTTQAVEGYLQAPAMRLPGMPRGLPPSTGLWEPEGESMGPDVECHSVLSFHAGLAWDVGSLDLPYGHPTTWGHP